MFTHQVNIEIIGMDRIAKLSKHIATHMVMLLDENTLNICSTSQISLNYFLGMQNIFLLWCYVHCTQKDEHFDILHAYLWPGRVGSNIKNSKSQLFLFSVLAKSRVGGNRKPINQKMLALHSNFSHPQKPRWGLIY